ncbi:hypothetical protein JOQ06_019765 [Pogonophryne albipinna]|uniref:RING-type domain-containing protein n=1 Tax=Pogonophryne albipinna TaxID=1090488 RepID=A0AAD6FWD2_9TELE|nr:hypothetical protein JOQ06_019765 [Pogonophryne albipinna]
MCTEQECGICYRTYNTGRRCPRELHCRHSFCESCLLALSRPQGPIVCPLCRQTTSISGTLRAELRVDECVLERLISSGVLDQEDEEDDNPEEEVCPGLDACDDADEFPETPAEEGNASTGSRGRGLRRSFRKVWRLFNGKRSRQRGGENCMTNDDLRNIAMMTGFMF